MHGISYTRSFTSGFAVLSKLGCSIEQYMHYVYISYYQDYACSYMYVYVSVHPSICHGRLAEVI